MTVVTLDLSAGEVAVLAIALQEEIDSERARLGRHIARSVTDPAWDASVGSRCALWIRRAELLYRRVTVLPAGGFWGKDEYLPACYRTPPLPEETAA